MEGGRWGCEADCEVERCVLEMEGSRACVCREWQKPALGIGLDNCVVSSMLPGKRSSLKMVGECQEEESKVETLLRN